MDMTDKLTRSHEDATIERFQNDPDFAVEYLATILNEGDKDELQHAKQLFAKACLGADPLE
jgi:DNA-binding phage protein